MAKPSQARMRLQGRVQQCECRNGRQSTLTCLADNRLGGLSSYTHQHTHFRK